MCLGKSCPMDDLFCFKLTGYKAHVCLQSSQTLLAFELGCSSWEGQNKYRGIQ